jgi:site-specific DNA recombinase
MRKRPRSEWKIIERPQMRIVSDELWERTQAARKEIREAVAPKRQLARGKSGKHHSPLLLTGFGTCAICGGAISCVSGGKGSPRLGCRRSWQQGLSTCTNRLTIRMKVAEPIIFGRLQMELSKPAALAYLVRKTTEVLTAKATQGGNLARLKKQLAQEQRKRDNLVAAVESGSDSPAVVMRAIATREANISELERQLALAHHAEPPHDLRNLPKEVARQLADLAKVLKGDDPARVKAALRDLNFALKFIPTDAAPRPHYLVEAQCDLSALGSLSVRLLAGSSTRRSKAGYSPAAGARLVLLGANQAPARTSSPVSSIAARPAPTGRSSR